MLDEFPRSCQLRPRKRYRIMKTRLTSAAVLLACFALHAQSPITLTTDAQRGELKIRYKAQKLLAYAFATNQFKPYVRELYTLRGENVLRDAPADHLHHHGLMYAIRINGTNFWEESGAPGVQKSIKILSHKTSKSRGGLPQAQFTQLIHWVPSVHRDAKDSAAVALLIERRTVALTVDEKEQEVGVTWDAEFQVGRNAGKVHLHGSDYNGLGLRMPKSFDKVARLQNSENIPYTGANTRNLIPAKWTSVSGEMNGKEMTIALFGFSKNTQGPGSFFTLLEPFAYLSVTQGLEKEPLDYSAGDRFSLSYLLTVYPAPKDNEFIQRRYELWEKQRR
jgi:hypothetical protein